MANNKAKRSILSAQPERRRPNPAPRPEPHPEVHPEALMPVKVHVYRTIAELNGGFEKVLQDLQTLGRVGFFRSGSVTAMHSLVSWIRAQVNRDFTMTLHDRELANAGYFDRLCAEAENQSRAQTTG